MSIQSYSISFEHNLMGHEFIHWSMLVIDKLRNIEMKDCSEEQLKEYNLMVGYCYIKFSYYMIEGGIIREIEENNYIRTCYECMKYLKRLYDACF